MHLLRFPRPGRRALGVLAALLLLLLGLVSASAMRQVQGLQQQVDVVVEHTLPTLRLARELQAQLDDLRGMSALHLSSAGAAERDALAARMRAQRQRMDRQLAAHLRQPGGADPAGEAAHRDEVQAGWLRYRALHDQLLQAAAGDAEAAAGRPVRALLAGEAQQAYQALRDALERWCEAGELRAEQARRDARAAGESAAWHLVLMVALGGLAAAAGGAWGLWPPPPAPPVPPRGDRAAAPRPAEAARSAVQAARAGPPARAAGGDGPGDRAPARDGGPETRPAETLGGGGR